MYANATRYTTTIERSIYLEMNPRRTRHLKSHLSEVVAAATHTHTHDNNYIVKHIYELQQSQHDHTITSVEYRQFRSRRVLRVLLVAYTYLFNTNIQVDAAWMM